MHGVEIIEFFAQFKSEWMRKNEEKVVFICEIKFLLLRMMENLYQITAYFLNEFNKN